jgi:hypothetical protein
MGIVPRPSQVILLVEDGRHEQFIVRYLRRLGLKDRDLRISKSPQGRGAAESWIQKQFAAEVKAYRTRQARVATKLVVVIDADRNTVQQRFRHMDQALQQAGVPSIEDDKEDIARLVPKRNIETWILCENGMAVDEDTDYKQTRNDWAELIRNGVDRLLSWTRPNATVPESCVDSLRLALPQLRKLDP